MADIAVTPIVCFQAGGSHSQTEAQIFTEGMQNDSEGLLQNFDLGDDIDLGDIFGIFGGKQKVTIPELAFELFI